MNERARVGLVAGAVVVVGGLAVVASRREGAAPAGPVLRVAVLAGDSTPAEKAVRAGLTLAAEALERDRGTSPRIELVFRDPAGSPVTAAKQLADLEAEGVRFVADVVGDDVYKGCAQLFREKKLVGTTTNDSPKLQGEAGQRVLRVAPWPAEDARALAEWTRELQPRRAVAIHGEDAASKAAAEAFSAGLVQLGGAESISVQDPKAQAAWVASRLQELGADVAAIFLSPEWTVAVLAAAGDQAPTTILTLEPAVGLAIAAGPTKGLASRIRFVVADARSAPRAEAVIAAWRASGGTGEPDPRLLAAHDALQILVRAAWAAEGDPDRALGLARSNPYEGATGRVTFLGDGERAPATRKRVTFTAEGVAVPFVHGSGS